MWLYWIALALISATYAAISLASFANIYRAYDDENTANDEELRGILAATIFGCVLAVVFIAFSFLIMLGKTLASSGAGFGYGLLLASTLHMSVTSLLCALVLQGFEEMVEDELEDIDEVDWQGVETNTYAATWSLAYACTGLYFAYFVFLLFSPGAFRKEEQDKKHASP